MLAVDPDNRLSKHIGDAYTREKHLPKARKIVKVLREGNEIEMRIRATSSSFEDIAALEKQTILIYGRRDANTGTLLNLTDGGDGHENYVWSAEARARASQRMLGSKLNEGRERPDMREKMSRVVDWYDRNGTHLGNFTSQKEAARHTGCNEMSIGKCISGKTKGCRSSIDNKVYLFASEPKTVIAVPFGSFQGDRKNEVRIKTRRPEWICKASSQALKAKAGLIMYPDASKLTELLTAYTLVDIAKMYSVSPSTISKLIKTYGLPSPDRNRFRKLG